MKDQGDAGGRACRAQRSEGERFLPDTDGPDLAYEHIHRYVIAARMVAGLRVLDLACGLGYSAAVLARLCAAVTAIESDEALARQAAATLAALEIDTAMVEHRPLAEGAPEQAPFDVIFLNGGAEALPEALTAQLREGGRIVGIDYSDGVGRAAVWTRRGDGLSRRRAFDAEAPMLEGFAAAAEFQF